MGRENTWRPPFTIKKIIMHTNCISIHVPRGRKYSTKIQPFALLKEGALQTGGLFPVFSSFVVTGIYNVMMTLKHNKRIHSFTNRKWR